MNKDPKEATARKNSQELSVKESCHGRQTIAERYSRLILYGLLWISGGIIYSAVSYNAVVLNPAGGRYIVIWGGILFGIYGLIGWLKYRNENDELK